MIRAHVIEKRLGGRIVLADLRLDVCPGEVLALVGPSGAGKTTLMSILAGLDRRYEGWAQCPRPLGMVFQEPNLLPWMSAADNIAVAAPLASRREIEDLLAALGLEGEGGQLPRRLSLGMARRVALARALAVRPQALLLDEPFVSLDEESAAQARRVVGEYCARHRPAMVLVSHNPADLAALATSVLAIP